MATVSKWTPFGVALDITATAGAVTRTSATEFTVRINASWETYYSGAETNYGMTASSGGGSATINKFGTISSSGSGSFTGTYSISGNASATKTITVTFKNFNTDNGKSATKTINLSVTVPAWTSYTVKYNANGGSGAPGSQTKWKDQALTLSTTKPTRTGYSFQGWATSASGSVAYAAGAKYTANASVTLYAIWKANTYTVSYNANGGSGAPDSQTKTYGVTLKLSSTNPTRTNYTFKGWATSASSTTVAYAAGANYTANASITLYAVWELAYAKPRITDFLVKRCDANGTATDDGACALVKFSWECDENVSSVLIEWKLSTDKSYSSSSSVTAQGTSGTVSQIIGGSALLTESSYTIKVTVTDSIGSFSKTKTLNSLTFTIHARPGGNGIAFGKTSELDGYADFKYDIVGVNNMKICGRDPNGNVKNAFQAQNDNGNTVIGYGNYDSKSGNTNIYGRDINCIICVQQDNGDFTRAEFKTYMRRGDTFDVELRTAGYVTNGGKDVSFLVPFNRPVVGSPKVTVASKNGFALRQGAKYTHGSGGNAGETIHPDSYSASLTTFNGIHVKATFSNTTNVTNNDAIGIYWSGTITFS